MSAANDLAPARADDSLWRLLRQNSSVMFGAVLLVVMVAAAVLAPALFTVDPTELDPIARLRAPGAEQWFGTDMYGRDIYSRTIYGTRISLIVGLCAAVLSVAIGLGIGLIAGYVRLVDAVVMRVMDGIMAIPGILLAIAMIALAGASLTTVVVA